jgi:hypothetical protein
MSSRAKATGTGLDTDIFFSDFFSDPLLPEILGTYRALRTIVGLNFLFFISGTH